jgi:hypothetical protein
MSYWPRSIVYWWMKDHDLLTTAMTQFNEQYQQRLRPYVIQERSGQDILWQLAQDQFGLVFAWGFFELHRPFEVLKQISYRNIQKNQQVAFADDLQ